MGAGWDGDVEAQLVGQRRPVKFWKPGMGPAGIGQEDRHEVVAALVRITVAGGQVQNTPG